MIEKYREEIEEVGKIFFRFSLLFTALSIFFFLFDFKKISISIYELYLPFPSFPSISMKAFYFFKKSFLPENVELVVLNPLDALVIQIQISLFLSFIFSFPFLVFQLSKFVLPALKKNEKTFLLKLFIPSIFFFTLGCAFAYFILIPLTFKFLYFYVFITGIKPFFDASQFVATVLALFVASGILFLLPVYMLVLTMFAGINPETYIKNFRIALVIFLILAAIITPDGSGITQILFALPLSLLYLLGYFWSRKIYKEENQ